MTELMTEPKPPDDLLAETLRRADQWAERDRRLSLEQERPAELGDVYVLEATRDYPVEWVLVTRGPANSGRFLVVPADGHFLVGSADLALPEASWIGDRRLRCRFGVWIDAGALESRGRVGVLDEGEIEPARRKWMEVGHAGVIGSVLAREVDEDPEYQQWVEDVLVPAHRMLGKSASGSGSEPGSASGSTPGSEPGGSGSVLPFDSARLSERPLGERPRPWSRVRQQITTLAATLAAAVVGLSIWVGQLRGRGDEPMVLRSLRPPDLSFRDPGRPVEVLVAWAEPEYWSLYLLLPQVSPLPASYRVRLLKRDSDEVVWESADLVVEDEYMLVLPRSISPGEYRLELEGRDEEGTRSLLGTRKFRLGEDHR